MIKLFISYSTRDEKRVSRIATLLDEAGFYTLFSAVDLRPGGDIMQWVNESLASCTHLVLFWSSDSAKSKWVKYEWQTALKHFVEGRTRSIVPIRLDKEPLPGRLSTIKFVDGTLPDATIAQTIQTAVAPTIDFANSKRKRLRELTGYSEASSEGAGELHKLLQSKPAEKIVGIYDFYYEPRLEPVFLALLRSSGVYGLLPMERKGMSNGRLRITGHLVGVKDSFTQMEQMLTVHEIDYHKG